MQDLTNQTQRVVAQSCQINVPRLVGISFGMRRLELMYDRDDLLELGGARALHALRNAPLLLERHGIVYGE